MSAPPCVRQSSWLNNEYSLYLTVVDCINHNLCLSIFILGKWCHTKNWRSCCHRSIYLFTCLLISIAFVACWCRQVMAQAVTGQQHSFVLMHSGIVNGYQLLCDANTVLEPQRGTAAFFFFTHYLPFPLFLFICVCDSDNPISFLVCLNSLC